MQPNVASTTNIRFESASDGFVIWQDPDGMPHSATIGGDPVPLCIEPGGSTTFIIERPGMSTLPGLDVVYEGPQARIFLEPNQDPRWEWYEPETFICLDPESKVKLAEIQFTLHHPGDGILIVGTLDIGGGHGN